jgi:hemin uptake protein HemP
MQTALHHSSLFDPSLQRSACTTQRTEDRLPAVDSGALLQGQKAVTIHHNGALYRLQSTRLGKLILTK